MDGIDISHWQSGIDLARVPCDFVITKATEGTRYVDPTFRRFTDKALSLGKLAGCYHYARGTDPIAEADHYVTAAADWVGRVLLVLDWESGGNPKWGHGEWTRGFVARVHDRTGVWPLVYVQKSAIGQIPQDVRATCPLWVAQYASASPTDYQPHPWMEGAYECAIRQYTENGHLPGYAGALDLNKSYISRDEWIRLAGGQEDDMPSAQEVADAVWNKMVGGGKSTVTVLTDIAAMVEDNRDNMANKVWDQDTNGVKARDRLTGIDGAANGVANTIPTLQTTIAAQGAAIETLSKSLGADPSTIAQAVQQAVTDKLASLKITVE